MQHGGEMKIHVAPYYIYAKPKSPYCLMAGE